MLFASGELLYPPATIRLFVAFGNGVELALVERTLLSYDTRTVRPRSAGPGSRLLLQFYLEGRVELEGVPVPTPFVLFEHEADYWGATTKPASALRAGGRRFSKIELTLRESLVTLPRPASPVVLALTGDLLEGTREVARSLREDSADRKRQVIADWFSTLARVGWIDTEVARVPMEPPSGGVARLWRALTPFLSTLDLGVTLRALAQLSNVTTRQAGRNIERLLAWSGHPVGFRSFVAEWRLRLAVMLLSAPHAVPEEVAKLVGYASLESMAAAFQATGLGHPAEVQDAVAGERD